MISETDLASLIAAIYEAGVDFSRWPQALSRVADALGAPSAGIAREGATLSDSWVMTHGLDPTFGQAYRDHYHAVNPIWRQTPDTPAGTVQTDTMVMPRSEFARTEFFADFLAPLQIGGMLNAVALMEDGRQTVVTVHSPREWEEEHVALYQRLTPHLRRAVELNVQLARAEINHAASVEVLNALEDRILFVDDAAAVVFANTAAQDAFGPGEGLRLGKDGLQADISSESAALRGLVAGCASQQPSGGAINVSRSGGRPPLRVRVSPVSKDAPAWLGRPAPVAIVCVSDPERLARPAAELLRERFGLTPAQATLAVEILDGDGIQAAADRLSITRATARTHLARIFEKAGVQRQSELVRVLLTGTLSIWRD